MPQRLRSLSLGLRLSDHQRYSVDMAVSKPTGGASLSNPDRDWRASLLYSYRFEGS